MTLLAVGAFALVAFAFGATPAAASCGVAGVVPANPYAVLPVVFVGTVTGMSHEGRVALVQVESVWRGQDLPPTVEVRGSPVALTPVPPGMGVSTSVDRHFQIGQRYVFAPSNGTPPFEDNACTSTRPYTPEVAALAPLDPLVAAASATERATQLPQGGASLVTANPLFPFAALVLTVGLSAFAARAWRGGTGQIRTNE